MKIKAYPRVWVDLSVAEVISVLLRMLNPYQARERKVLPEFEQAFADFIGTKEAVAFPNCRSSLYFSLKALDLNKDDEVILPAFTFWVDAAVTVLAGLKPVFVDVDFQTLNIDARQIEKAITPRTKVILPAHLNGLSCDMDVIMRLAAKYGLRVIEDCARICAGRYHGQRVGSFDIGAFSFGYGKSFYGFGGGMVTSDDTSFIKRLRGLKSDFKTISIKNFYQVILKGCLLKFLNSPYLYGFGLFPAAYRHQIMQDSRFDSWFKIKKPLLESVPDAFKLDMYDLQARLGFRQIRTIDRSNQRRRRNLAILNRELSGIDGLHIPPEPADREHVCVHYALWSEDKKELQKFLMDNKIDAQDESAQDLTLMERFASYASAEFPNARKLNAKIIYLPVHPCLTEKDMFYIAGKVKEFFRTKQNQRI